MCRPMHAHYQCEKKVYGVLLGYGLSSLRKCLSRNKSYGYEKKSGAIKLLKLIIRHKILNNKKRLKISH